MTVNRAQRIPVLNDGAGGFERWGRAESYRGRWADPSQLRIAYFDGRGALTGASPAISHRPLSRTIV